MSLLHPGDRGAMMRDKAERLPSAITFGREICGDLAAVERREWLVTNGLGGYASGTVAGLLTRRYHGLLVAALRLDTPLRSGVGRYRSCGRRRLSAVRARRKA